MNFERRFKLFFLLFVLRKIEENREAFPPPSVEAQHGTTSPPDVQFCCSLSDKPEVYLYDTWEIRQPVNGTILSATMLL
jgi:hypothetical protein